ncbi:competence protein CoiA [Brevibacillus sp. H7]|uniref:competence protein CoiA n=1 Tax=Brevibacillus sp. H7 TaxID=3349138 RepID=UPI00381C0222
MKTCLHEDGHFIELGTYPEPLLRRWSSKSLRCAECLRPVKYRHGKQISPHFAHVVKCAYEYHEPETEEHVEGKKIIKQWLEQALPQNQTYTEYHIKELNQRSDVMTVFPDGTRICFEIQCSAIPIEVLQSRMEGYRNENIHQIWIVGKSVFQAIIPARFTLRTWMYEISRAQQGRLYFLDLTSKSLLSFNGVKIKQPYKTIFTCEWAKSTPLVKVTTSSEGELLLGESITLHSTKTLANQDDKAIEIISVATGHIINDMKNFTSPSTYLKLLKRRQQEFDKHPIKHFVVSRLGEEKYLDSPLFNQSITGDHAFLLDHRLWQSHLFSTEILNAYARKAKFSMGQIKPTIFIKYLITKDNRFPDRPFMNIVNRYVNWYLLKAKRMQPMDFSEVLTIHEVIYEYLSRLVTLGILRNVTPKQESITTGGRMFGRFEILFDRFWPVQFGETEADIRRFFELHVLRYQNGKWFVKRKKETGSV